MRFEQSEARLRSQRLFSSQLPRPHICINICATTSIMTALVVAIRALECSECGLDSAGTRCFRASILDSKKLFSSQRAAVRCSEAQSSASRTCPSSGGSHPLSQASFGETKTEIEKNKKERG